MPCRVVIDCPCCGQPFDGEVKLSTAVKRLEESFDTLKQCHAQEERDSEKRLRDEFQRERDGYEIKLSNAAVLVAGKKKEALRKCSDDELIAELARRRQ